jgi:sentrin-specific protease 1
MIIGFCLPWMESKEENVALTVIQRDNTLSIDESLLMSLSHNKPKNSVTTTIVPKGMITSILLYGSICIVFIVSDLCLIS